MSSLVAGLESILGESGAGPRQGRIAQTEEGGYVITPESERQYRTRQAKGYARRGQTYAATVPGMTVGSILDSLLHNKVALAGLVGAGLGLGIGFVMNTSVDAAIAYMVVFGVLGIAVVVVLPMVLKLLPLALL